VLADVVQIAGNAFLQKRLDCQGVLRKLLERVPTRIEVRTQWRSSSEWWWHLRL